MINTKFVFGVSMVAIMAVGAANADIAATTYFKGNAPIIVDKGTISVTVDSELKSTSENPVQNKVINTALAGKLSTSGTAAKATADASGNNIVDTYATKTALTEGLAGKQGTLKAGSNITIASDGTISATDTNTQVTVDTALSSTSTNPVQNKVINTALSGKLANTSTIKNAIVTTDANGAVAPVEIVDSGTGTYVTDVAVSAGKVTLSRGTPSIPTVNNATLTIQKNGADVGTFTANASANKAINITVPTGGLASKDTISNADVADDAAIAQSKISGLTSALAGKQASLGYTAENSANKVTTVSSTSTDTQYPSAKAVYGYVSGELATVNNNNNTLKSRVDTLEETTKALDEDKQDMLTATNVTTTGGGNVVTAVSASNGTVTVTKGASLPTVYDATLTIKNGATNGNLATFTANSSASATATIPAASATVAGLAKIGVIPSGSATSATYATIWVE